MQETGHSDNKPWSPYMLRQTFLDLAGRCGMQKGDAMLFAGCAGGCYSQATLFAFYLKDLQLRLFFLSDADPKKAYPLEFREGLGFIATSRVEAPMAKTIVVMSGLCRAPVEHVLKLIAGKLLDGGKVVGESNIPGIYEEKGWSRRIPFDYKVEFAVDAVRLLSR